MDKSDSRVDLERLFQMSPEDFRTKPVSYESLLADVDKLGLETEALSTESTHLRDVKDEVEELTRSLESLSSPKRASKKQPASKQPRRKARAETRSTRRRISAKAAAPVNIALDMPLIGTSLVVPDRSGEVSTSGRQALPSRADRAQGWGRVADSEGSKTKRKAGAGFSGNQLDSLKTAKVLTPADEFSLACKVQKYVVVKKKFDALAEELHRNPTDDEFAAHLGSRSPTAVQDFMTRGKNYKEAFFAANVRLVVSIARKMHPRSKGVELSDLVAEGLRGLETGIERFDPHKGFKFSTYAHWWIRQSIMFVLNEQVSVVRFPPSMRAAARRVLDVRTQLRQEYGRLPTDLEVSAAAGVTQRRLTELMRLFAKHESLDVSLSDDPNSETLGESIEDPDTEKSETRQLQREGLEQDMEATLRCLTYREAAIVRLRFGLPHDGEPGRKATLAEIGQRFSVTKERIRQIEGKALFKLRQLGAERLAVYGEPEESEWGVRSTASATKAS